MLSYGCGNLEEFEINGLLHDLTHPELDFVHYEGKQSAYSSRLNKRD